MGMMSTNPLPVPVGASVFVSARGAQYILNAQGGKICQQNPQRPSQPADRPAIGQPDYNEGVTVYHRPPSHCSSNPPHPTNPRGSSSHKVISLLVSFVQPVIV